MTPVEVKERIGARIADAAIEAVAAQAEVRRLALLLCVADGQARSVHEDELGEYLNLAKVWGLEVTVADAPGPRWKVLRPIPAA